MISCIWMKIRNFISAMIYYSFCQWYIQMKFFLPDLFKIIVWLNSAWSFFLWVFFLEWNMQWWLKEKVMKIRRETNLLVNTLTRKNGNDSFIHSFIYPPAHMHAHACIFIRLNWIPLPSFWYHVLTSFYLTNSIYTPVEHISIWWCYFVRCTK